MVFIHYFENIFTEHTVQCRQCAVNVSGLHLSATVTGEQRNIKPCLFYHITNSSEVFFICCIRTVFIFYLHHDNISAIVDG